MNEPAISRDPQALLALDGFVRDLARGLVASAHDADDVAQQSWSIALAGQRRGASERAWLAGIVRHVAQKLLRRESRLARRERAAARPEAIPSNDAMREREAARRDVVEALLSLDEPYRATLLLRFLDGLPPRAVARRMQVPVETVRTRIKRGLERLRATLEARHRDDRGALGAALMALAWPARDVATAGFGIGVLLMAKTKLVAAVLALAALSFFVWRGFGAGAGPTSDAPEVAGPAIAGAPLPRAPEHAASAPSTQRVATTTEAAQDGVLDVRVVMEKDQSPVPGVLVHVWPRGAEQPIFAEQSARTDGAGRVRFTGLALGHTLVTSERGGHEQPEITATGRAEATIALREAQTISGVVVDPAGAPVADADVAIYSWERPHMALCAGRTRADGTFAIEVRDGSGFLEARARAWSPSARYALQRGARQPGNKAPAASQSLRLVLGPPAGSLTGSVFMLQRPVANAIVLVGCEYEAGTRNDTRVVKSMRQLEDGSHGLPPRPGSFRTGADGRFVADGLPPGRHAVLARGPGSALWTGTIEIVSGQQGTLTIDLLPGVTVTGTVRDAGGEPVWGARVQDDHWDPLDEAAPWTRKDGSFRLIGLAAGNVALLADGGERGRATIALQAQPGQLLVWNATLDPGLVLRGVLVDEAGKALPLLRVEASMAGDRTWYRELQADAQGRFELRGCPDRPIDLTISSYESGQALERVRGVRAGKDEVRVVVRGDSRASIHIAGRIVGPDGEPVAGATVIPARNGTSDGVRIEATNANGRFLLGPYPPGEWSLRITSRGLAPLAVPPRTLAANATWDAGTITLSTPGHLIVAARRTDGQPLSGTQLGTPFGVSYLVALGVASGDAWHIEIRDGRIEPLPLAAGSYVLNVRGGGFACESFPFTIRSGEATRLSVELRPGIARTIHFVLPAGDPARAIRVTVRDAAERVVLTERVFRDPEAPLCAWPIGLAAGTYVVDARAEPRADASTPARTGNATLVVTAAAETGPLRIELR